VIRGLFKGDISFASVHRMKCTFSTWVRFFKQFAPMNMMIKVDLSDEIHFIVVICIAVILLPKWCVYKHLIKIYYFAHIWA